MRRNLIFCCGLTELLTCSAILRKLTLDDETVSIVLYGRKISMPQKLIEGVKQQASDFGVWNEIIDLTGLCDEVLDSRNYEEQKRLLAPWQETFGQSDRIFIHTLWKPLERLFIDMCAQAQIILYDNGLDSHNERSVKHCRQGDVIEGVREADLERVAQAYFTLGDYLPIPRYLENTDKETLSADSIKNEIQSVGSGGVFSVLRNMLPAVDRHVAIIAGTAFYRNKNISLAAETDIYRRYILNTVRSGAHVIFKDHPRANLALDIGDMDGVTVLTSPMPLEFIPCVVGTAITASISSTATLSIKKLFGIPYAVLGEAEHESLKLKWMPKLIGHASTVLP